MKTCGLTFTNKTGNQIDETTDTYDTVDWLIKNVPNNNGRVGVWGISYPGFLHFNGRHRRSSGGQSDLATGAGFRLVSRRRHESQRRAVSRAELQLLCLHGPARARRRRASNDYVKPYPWGTQDGYKFFLEMGGLGKSGDLYWQKVGLRSKFWDQMLLHPNYDQFWKERNILPNLKNIRAAVMTVGGWYDNEDLYGALETYQYIEKQNPGIYNVLVMGPWFHGGWVAGRMATGWAPLTLAARPAFTIARITSCLSSITF